jgi:hypothetical protein
MKIKKSTEAKELARVFHKTKKVKTEISLTSDGSVWERTIFKKKSGLVREKIKGPWIKINRMQRPDSWRNPWFGWVDLRRIFLTLFKNGGWRHDKKKGS